MNEAEAKVVELLTEIRNDQRDALAVSREVAEMSRQLAASYKKLTPLLATFFVVAILLFLLVGGVFLYDIFFPPQRIDEQDPNRNLSVTYSASVDAVVP